MKVKYYNIDKEFQRSYKKFNKHFLDFKKTGNLLLGKHLNNFEKKLSNMIGSKHVLGVANGTDALELSIKSLNPPNNSEIITTSNTFVSTVNSIINVGCKPVFADIDTNYNIDPNKIENHINKKTFAIMPVHLNGLPACMNKIRKISKKYNLHIIEDAAQSILSTYHGKYIGNQKNLACFSMHPTKNLGVLGDGGFISTNDTALFKKLKLLRNHGLKDGKSIMVGRNSRLNEINSLVAYLRLDFLKQDTLIKQKIANFYNQNLTSNVITPRNDCCRDNTHAYHRYVVRVPNRDKLIKYLTKNNIEVKVHYPKNIHEYKIFTKYLKNNTNLTNTLNYSKEILSLPCNHFMSIKHAEFVVNKINRYYESS